MNPIGDSSSSALLEIQIEESLSRETLMNIDSTNHDDDRMFFLLCPIILILCFLSSLLLPPVTQTIERIYPFETLNAHRHPQIHPVESSKSLNQIELSQIKSDQYTEQSEIFRSELKTSKFSIESLSSSNQFLDLSLIFILDNSLPIHYQQIFNRTNQKVVILDIETNIDMQIHHQSKTDNRFLSEFSVIFSRFSNQSQKIPSFRLFLTKYSTYQITLSLLHHQFYQKFAIDDQDLFQFIVGFKAIWTFGNSSIPFYQSFIKLLYFSVILVLMILFFMRTRQVSVSVLHLEQKLTICLLFISFLIDNPFHFILIDKCPSFSMFFDELSIHCFNVYLRFFILVLFDSLRFKNRKINHCFLTPKLIFFVIFLFIEVYSGFLIAKHNGITRFRDLNINFDLCNYKQDFKTIYSVDNLRSNEMKLSILYSFKEQFVLSLFKVCQSVFYIWLSIVVIRSFFEIDVTERYKFFVYLAMSLMLGLLIHFSDHVIRNINRYQNTLVLFLFKLSVENLFAISMILFHWPYELITDQQYLYPNEMNHELGDLYDSDK